MDKTPVEDEPYLFRDPYSKAIINSNTLEYENYMRSYSKRQEKRHEFDSLKDEVNDLKSNISDIKNLLNKLLEVKNDN
jgi:O-methyltransferase involved in polyketide biosynthesis